MKSLSAMISECMSAGIKDPEQIAAKLKEYGVKDPSEGTEEPEPAESAEEVEPDAAPEAPPKPPSTSRDSLVELVKRLSKGKE